MHFYMDVIISKIRGNRIQRYYFPSLPRVFLYVLGVIPSDFLNTLIKDMELEKPTASAMSFILMALL